METKKVVALTITLTDEEMDTLYEASRILENFSYAIPNRHAFIHNCEDAYVGVGKYLDRSVEQIEKLLKAWRKEDEKTRTFTVEFISKD